MLFNTLPPSIRNIADKTKDIFKSHLDKWFRNIPDTPKIDGYRAFVGTESNSIVHQARYFSSE